MHPQVGAVLQQMQVQTGVEPPRELAVLQPAPSARWCCNSARGMRCGFSLAAACRSS